VARLITQGGLTTPTYLYPDHLGTASLAANASGYITWWESYSPFGETLNNAPQGFNQPGFTGHIRDTATGLNYMQARYYDPVIGRFLSNDPVGFAEMIIEGNFGYFNRYSYTFNDPINLVDPTGMSVDCENMGTCPTSMYGEGSPESSNCAAAGTCGGQTSDDVLDFLPIIGDIKGIQDFAQDPSLISGVAAGVGILPVVGDIAGAGIKAAVRGGDNVADSGTIFVDSAGNALPAPPGGSLTGSPDGAYLQTRNADGSMTGIRKDGGHGASHADPRARRPHGHQPGVTNEDGTPWLPIRERNEPE
jgi:RHS repeat-associated protein